ncbi:MAG: hypothetical protein OXC40_03100 [Proteobacteria bacterium]|nr:hypothetical protein [Pseudomonadota bacterium]
MTQILLPHLSSWLRRLAIYLALLAPLLPGCSITTRESYISIKLADNSSARQSYHRLSIYKREQNFITKLRALTTNRGSHELFKSIEVSSDIFGSPGLLVSPGKYLILADCSHASVTVKKGHTQELTLQQLTFHQPPVDYDGEDGMFQILCERFGSPVFSQKLTSIFKLYLLSNIDQIFIHMMPLTVTLDLSERSTHIDLAALRINTANNEKTKFFLSQDKASITMTAGLPVARWIYFLPGEYRIAVNGSTKSVTLEAQTPQEITLGALRVATPAKTPLDYVTRFNAEPPTFSLRSPTEQTHHTLRLNTTYPLLPGTYEIKLTGGHQTIQVSVVAGKQLTIPLNTITIHSPCTREASTWQQQQLCPKIGLTLYESITDEPTQGSVGVPILFFAKKILVQLHSAHGIKQAVNARPGQHKEVVLGSLTLTPKVTFQNNRATELIRLEVLDDNTRQGFPNSIHNSSHLGDSKERNLMLLPGEYQLVSYESIKTSTRFKQKKQTVSFITLAPNSSHTVTYPFYRRLPQTQPANIYQPQSGD